MLAADDIYRDDIIFRDPKNMFQGKKDFWREEYPQVSDTPAQEPKLSTENDAGSDTGRLAEPATIKS